MRRLGAGHAEAARGAVRPDGRLQAGEIGAGSDRRGGAIVGRAVGGEVCAAAAASAGEDRPSVHPCEGELRERSGAAADDDHHVPGQRGDGVAGVTEPGRQHDRAPRVGVVEIGGGQDGDRDPSGAHGYHSISVSRLIDPNPYTAIPSLHAAYPFLVLLFAVKFFRRRGLIVLPYVAIVWFAVIYLGEHYATDVLIGAAYATAAFFAGPLAVRAVARIRWRPAAFVPVRDG